MIYQQKLIVKKCLSTKMAQDTSMSIGHFWYNYFWRFSATFIIYTGRKLKQAILYIIINY